MPYIRQIITTLLIRMNHDYISTCNNNSNNFSATKKKVENSTAVKRSSGVHAMTVHTHPSGRRCTHPCQGLALFLSIYNIARSFKFSHEENTWSANSWDRLFSEEFFTYNSSRTTRCPAVRDTTTTTVCMAFFSPSDGLQDPANRIPTEEFFVILAPLEIPGAIRLAAQNTRLFLSTGAALHNTHEENYLVDGRRGSSREGSTKAYTTMHDYYCYKV